MKNIEIIILIITSITILVIGATISYAPSPTRVSPLDSQQANEMIDVTIKLTKTSQELDMAKKELGMVHKENEQLRKKVTSLTTELENLKIENTLPDPVASEPMSNVDYCSIEPSKRQCSQYNIQYLNNKKFICPKNYTIMDGYPPGGVKGPVCHMNSGTDNRPNTCKTFHDPGCNPHEDVIPCYGRWPCATYACYNYYNQWFVVRAMPASEVCAVWSGSRNEPLP